MPLAQIAGKRIFFAHIPKTGGSSLEAWMAAAGRLEWRGRKPLAGMRCTPQHMEAALYAPLLEVEPPDAAFAVLRAPEARLISEYRYRRAQVTRKGAREMPPFGRWVKRAFRLYGEDTYFLDNHIRPQAHFLQEGMTLFRFEDGLDPVFDWLEELTGKRDLDRPHKLRRSGRVEVEEGTRQAIAEFYAEDETLWKSLGYAGA